MLALFIVTGVILVLALVINIVLDIVEIKNNTADDKFGRTQALIMPIVNTFTGVYDMVTGEAENKVE